MGAYCCRKYMNNETDITLETANKDVNFNTTNIAMETVLSHGDEKSEILGRLVSSHMNFQDIHSKENEEIALESFQNTSALRGILISPVDFDYLSESNRGGEPKHSIEFISSPLAVKKNLNIPSTLFSKIRKMYK